MKLLSACLIVILTCGIALSGAMQFGIAQNGTNVSGTISADTTWTQANSPYTLTGNVLVGNGATLTVEAGTTVNLGTYYIMVNGTLVAIGQSNSPIYFNGGLITFTQFSTNWNDSTSNGCIIQNASLTSSLSIDSSANISNNTIQGNSSNSIDVVGASPTISGNTISNNYYGVSISAGTPTITENVISNCAWGVFISGTSNSVACSPLVSNNILDNDSVGIIVNALNVFSGTANVTENLIVDSQGNQAFNPATGGSAGIVIGSGETSSYVCYVTNNTISSNSFGISVCGSPITSLTYNNIYGNQYNMYLTYDVNVNAVYNWWGATDTQAINQTIYDYKNNYNLGTVSFVPLLSAVNPEAPTIPIFNITASAGVYGAIAPSGVVSVNYGGSQTFNITPNTGYSILDVSVNGASVGAVSAYTVQNIQGPTTISATFAPNPTSTATPTPPPISTPTPTPTTSPNQPSSSSKQNPTSIYEILIATLVVLIIAFVIVITVFRRGKRR